MLVMYLADVLPFRRVMDRKAGMVHMKGFVWFKTGKPCETDDLTRVFRRETGARLGLGVTTADYRHIAIAIDREHVRGLMDGMDGMRKMCMTSRRHTRRRRRMRCMGFEETFYHLSVHVRSRYSGK
jgi:hypothetical protein